MSNSVAVKMYELAEKLWPLNRSLTGQGVRSTLRYVKEILPNLEILEIPTGTQVFDWVIPKEWKVHNAWIVTPDGKKICDFSVNNLHLVGYSMPINTTLSLAELNQHLYSLPDQPSAIPYITSYYQERWGFCLTQNQRNELVDGDYEVFIDAELFEGSLTYAELIIPGLSEKEVFLSTYVCHPSMANNELSGLVVTTYLAKWLSECSKNKYTHRIIFIPETIGSIMYLSKNLKSMKSNIIAGYNVSCVGDERGYSYLPSRRGNTLSDVVGIHMLKHLAPDFKSYTWKDRGSDERQYCAPHIDLPIASVMRTKYGEYPEYHTSLDNLINVVTKDGLLGGYNVLKHCLEAINHHCYPSVNVYCEPQLGKRGLYPTLSTKNTHNKVSLMMNLITWSDGKNSLIEIAEICGVPVWDLYPIIKEMQSRELITLNRNRSDENSTIFY